MLAVGPVDGQRHRAAGLQRGNRDLLLDTRGSMSGRPLEQARSVVGSLTDTDTLELIEFSNAPRRWKSKPVKASAKARQEALAWLTKLHAGGSTEITGALYEALTGLRDEAQRQVVLVTELTVSGSALVACATKRLPDLFGGAPALLSLELAPAGGTLIVTGATAAGPFEKTLKVSVDDTVAGHAAIPALFAREAVEDLELLAAASGGGTAHDPAIEKLGLEFQISTRLTSWVAISDEATVDPRKPTRRQVMPQQLPYGMSVEGVGLRGSRPPALHAMPQMCSAPPMAALEAKVHFRMPPQRRVMPPPPPRPVPPCSRTDDREEDDSEPSDIAASLEAQLVLQGPNRLVLEFEVPTDGLDWYPGAVALVTLSDGRTVELEVDETATTAEGEADEGTTVRLVLRLEAPLKAGVAPVRIDLADDSYALVVVSGIP